MLSKLKRKIALFLRAQAEIGSRGNEVVDLLREMRRELDGIADQLAGLSSDIIRTAPIAGAAANQPRRVEGNPCSIEAARRLLSAEKTTKTGDFGRQMHEAMLAAGSLPDDEVSTAGPAGGPRVNLILEDRFTKVYDGNLWGDDESVSGPGSRKGSEVVSLSIQALKFVVETFHVTSVNDIPCGDFNWIGEFLEGQSGIDYTGFDIVGSLVERNNNLFAGHKFRQFDIVSDIPPYSDLIFSKELFLHLTYDNIIRALVNMKRSGAKYLLTSNHFGAQNVELPDDSGGAFRPLDLCAGPIALPEPIWKNFLFGLWRFSDILEPSEPISIAYNRPASTDRSNCVEMCIGDVMIRASSEVSIARLAEVMRAARLSNS